MGFSDRDPRFDNTAHMLTSPNVAVDPVSTDFDGIASSITRIRQSGIARHAEDLPSGLAEQAQASSCSEPPCVWTCPALTVCPGVAVGGFSVECGMNARSEWDLMVPCPSGGVYSKTSGTVGQTGYKGLGCFTPCITTEGNAGTQRCSSAVTQEDPDNFCRDPDRTFPTASQCQSLNNECTNNFSNLPSNFTSRLHNDGPYCCFTTAGNETCFAGYTTTSAPGQTGNATEKCCMEYTGGTCYP